MDSESTLENGIAGAHFGAALFRSLQDNPRYWDLKRPLNRSQRILYHQKHVGSFPSVPDFLGARWALGESVNHATALLPCHHGAPTPVMCEPFMALDPRVL